MRFPQDVPTLTDGPDSIVTLRAHRPDDAPAVLEQCLDPVSQAWTTVPLTYSRADADTFVRDVAPGAWRTEAEHLFAVEAVDDAGVARFAGTVSLRPEGERRAEVAFGSHPWVRGRGVMERAVRMLLRWGFDALDLRTVIWWANRGNWASRKLAWRLGFVFEGSLRQWLPQRGELLDAWVGTLTAGEPMQPRSRWYDVPRLGDGTVSLRAPEPRDLPRVEGWSTDPVTARWLGQIPQPYGPEHAREWLRETEEQRAAGRAVTWVVTDPGTDLALGALNLFDLNPHRSSELGYALHPDARGRGVGARAAHLVVRHAFVDVADGGLGLARVRARIAEGNTASRALVERLGFTLQGRERRAMPVQGGRLEDAAVYDVLPGELVGPPS